MKPCVCAVVLAAALALPAHAQSTAPARPATVAIAEEAAPASQPIPVEE
jgi:hypothetical protein